MQVESIFSKLNTLLGMLKRLQPVQKKEVEDAANLLLSLIDRMKNDASLLPMRYSQMEANAYNALGVIAINEGSEESARRALAHIEKALEINKAIGCARGIAIAKANIAIARLMYDSVNNDDELLQLSQELYELRVAKLGEEHECTIIAGKDYALTLQKVNHGDEARELLTKLLSTSKQVLGPHHILPRILNQSYN
jgi:tetratricopeptide (TPR) repeat protein